MYRGKDIGSRKQLTNACLEHLKRGALKQLYEVLPHIAMIRSPTFLPPLLHLLADGNRKRKLFAALALGSLGDKRSILPLFDAFMEPTTFIGSYSHALQTAIIVALGEIGRDGSVAPLMRIYRLDLPRDPFGLRRKKLVISALGHLIQHQSPEAETELVQLLRETRPPLRIQAITELGVAFWNRPDAMSDTLFEEMLSLTEDPSEEVRSATFSALYNLAEVGSRRARDCFRREDE